MPEIYSAMCKGMKLSDYRLCHVLPLISKNRHIFIAHAGVVSAGVGLPCPREDNIVLYDQSVCLCTTI